MLGTIGRAYQAAFSGLPRPVWLLAFASLVNRSGTMVLPFLGLYLTEGLGFTALTAGRILALYGLGGAVGAWIGGQLSDRFGALRVQVASLLATGIGFLLIGQARSVWLVGAVVFVTTAVGDAYRPAVFTAVAQLTPLAIRTRALALLRLAGNLGMSIGPAVGGFLAAHHYGLLFVVDALTCWLAALFIAVNFPLRTRPAPPASGGAGGIGRTPWRDRQYLVFLALIIMLGTMFFQFFSTLPLYLRSVYGLRESTIGGLLALNAIIIVATEMVVVRAVEDRNHVSLLGVGCLLVGVGLGLLPLGRGVTWAAFTVVVWTAGEMLSLPFSNTIAATRGSAGASGAYVGAYSLAFSVAMVIAPLVGTWLYQAQGPDVVWLITALGGGILAVAFRLLRRSGLDSRHGGDDARRAAA